MAEGPDDILFLVHRAPWPPDRGDRIRSWHMFEALRAIAPVHVAALADTPADAAMAMAKMAPLAANVHIVPRTARPVPATLMALARREPASLRLFANAALAAHVDALVRRGTVGRIVAFSSQMAQYLPPRSAFAGPVVMDFVDVDSAKFEAYAAADRPGPMRWVHAREGRMLGEYEAAVAQRADASLFVSDAEAALFRARAPSARNVMTLENGIALDHFAPDADWQALAADERPAGPMAVFTGQMDYRPNIAAVRDFAEQVLPLLRRAHPTACFAIVGRAPTAEVRALADRPGVIVTGEVPDTRPWLAAADVVVAPLQVARGVQNKLLEAMAIARPVVASTAAAQGIDARVGRDLLVADEPQALADAVSGLFADATRAAAMGTAARLRMQQRYSWDAAMAPLRTLVGLGGA